MMWRGVAEENDDDGDRGKSVVRTEKLYFAEDILPRRRIRAVASQELPDAGDLEGTW